MHLYTFTISNYIKNAPTYVGVLAPFSGRFDIVICIYVYIYRV